MAVIAAASATFLHDWWVAAFLIGFAYVSILGPGIRFTGGGGTR